MITMYKYAFDPTEEVFGFEKYSSFADRFPNRNFISMEDTSTLFLRDGIGELKNLSELEKAHLDGQRVFVIENREEHSSKIKKKAIPLTTEEVKQLIDDMKKSGHTHPPDHLLEKMVEKKTGYKYNHYKSRGSSSSYSEHSWMYPIGIGLAVGVPIDLYRWHRRRQKEKHIRKRKK